MSKYFALYDLQIEGFKAGHAGETYEEVFESGVERIYTLSLIDKDPAPDDLSDEELMDLYGYEVREVSQKEYETILNSEEYGLLTSVTLEE